MIESKFGLGSRRLLQMSQPLLRIGDFTVVRSTTPESLVELEVFNDPYLIHHEELSCRYSFSSRSSS